MRWCITLSQVAPPANNLKIRLRWCDISGILCAEREPDYLPSSLTTKQTYNTMTQRNITRYTYETTSFQGWRLSICRKWNQFTKYFSDRQYGSEEAAFQAALEMRDRIFDALRKTPDDPRGVFERFKNGVEDELAQPVAVGSEK